MDHDTNSQRGKIVNYLQKQLIGPTGDDDETIQDKPHKRYLMGILFPIEAVEDELDSNTPDEIDNTISLASEFKPSSMGISFAVSSGTELIIDVSAGSYFSGTDKSQWKRKPLQDEILFDCDSEEKISRPLFESRGSLLVIKRPWKNGSIITVALTNTARSGSCLDPADCLYQAKIHCNAIRGRFEEYPSSDRFRFDDEQQELSLLYRNRVNWSVGHGCASAWDQSTPTPTWISTCAMPSHEVHGFKTSIDFSKYPNVPENILNLQRLSSQKKSNDSNIIRDLRALVGSYKDWIEDTNNEKVNDSFRSSQKIILARLRATATRMDKGISALENSKNGMRAFRLANKAMLMQMVHSSNKFGGKVKARNKKPFAPQDYDSSAHALYSWRPFQLAFQLLVIESLIRPEGDSSAESLDIVDLLWFPTGGGKTEAYLAVAAWEMFYRRLEDGSRGSGTAVIKRYTLRLLTSQQFQRAGTLICAMENIRSQLEIELGTEPFNLGLWVGQGSTPNRFCSGDVDHPEALEKFKFLKEEERPENPFQLQRCPWCGTTLVPKEKSKDDQDYGISATETSFTFFCPTNSCPFHPRLPIQIVDEALYQSPPSMLIGTIDKFARLAWVEETSAFFGKNGEFNPPSLIIQDELHLISGPLGTMSGIYEAGIDSLIRRLGGHAKVIAATATIRAASQQGRRLFGREVQVFPPSGIDEKDSFFSQEDKTTPGRLYLGIMPSGHTGQTALVQTSAAILQSPVETTLNEECKDTWWTLPIYHNSRRELGKTMTLARDDIPARIKVIANQTGNERECAIVEELSANVKGAQIPEVLEKLELDAGTAGVIDILPCTNMISVGVDISRLGVMLINGQPKTTAEYIQASSRVGRDKKRPPAIVLTLYSPSKPRDRSHYETFPGYHQALYRHVEPTSITPWAKPARERALHAALVILVRLSGYLPNNNMAGNFDKENNDFIAMYNGLTERIKEASSDLDSKEVTKILSHLDELVEEWHRQCTDQSVNRYEAERSGAQFKPLLEAFGKENKIGLWSTLNSMRNVDTETSLWVKGEQQ